MKIRSTRLVIVLGVIAALVGAAVTSGIASAHSRPIRFDPAPGAVLQAGPAKVDGWFGSDIRRDPNWSFIHVTDAQGARADTGETAIASNRLQMTATLKPNLAPGMYLVTWRTFDDGDNEIFGDCYTFFVGQAAGDAAVAAKTRLDGGSKCERIEVSAKNGTPTPQEVSAMATATIANAGAADDHGHDDSGGSSTSKLLLGLVIGAVGGVVLGGVGGRLVGKRPS